MTWVRRFEVRSTTDASASYTVAIDDNGAWGCSCPAWKFKKKDHTTGLKPDCKHILGVRGGMVDSRRRQSRALDRELTRSVPRASVPTEPDRFAGLDLDPLPMVRALKPKTQYRYLDLDVTVME